MLTTEVRVNGTLIAHLYARNTCSCSVDLLRARNSHECSYTYEYYEVESGKLRIGEVQHDRSAHSFRGLLVKILKDVEKEPEDILEDGCGNAWLRECPVCKERSMEIVRPGSVQCGNPNCPQWSEA